MVLYQSMSKKNTKPTIKPGSPEAEFALQGAIGIVHQQLASIDETIAITKQALEEAEILKLFNRDPKTLSPQQVELLTIAANGIKETLEKLSGTFDTTDVIKALTGGKKESK